MLIRTTTIGLLLVIAGAFAQDHPGGPGPGRGRMGFGGPEIGARFIGAEAGMPGRVVKNAPYSADVVTESTQTLPDGNRIRQSTAAKVYRDSEGRTRREQSVNLSGLTPNANMPQVVFIHDPVAGFNLALNARDRTGTKSAWTSNGGRGPQMSQGQGPRPRETAPGGATGNPDRPMGRRPGTDQNIKTESLGRQSIEGVLADGTRTTMTIPAGRMGNELPIQIVSEHWYSAELQTMVLSRRSDPRMGETVTKLANVSRGEPSRILFEAPADYKVTESAGRTPRPRGAPVDK
jgi:hypothetical protein